MTRHDPGDAQSGAGGGLARPDVGRAVDLGETVAAIARKAQRAAPPGDLAAAQDRDRDRVARLERDRPAVDDDPPADSGRERRGKDRIEALTLSYRIDAIPSALKRSASHRYSTVTVSWSQRSSA